LYRSNCRKMLAGTIGDLVHLLDENVPQLVPLEHALFR